MLLGVPPEKLRGVVLGVLGETRFRRVMEVGHLGLVVVVTHPALQFGSYTHRQGSWTRGSRTCSRTGSGSGTGWTTTVRICSVGRGGG